jgi:hypothetical protein
MESKSGEQRIDWLAAVNTALEVGKFAWQIYQFFQGKQSNSSSLSPTGDGASTPSVPQVHTEYPTKNPYMPYTTMEDFLRSLKEARHEV